MVDRCCGTLGAMGRDQEIHEAIADALHAIDDDNSPLDLVGDIPHIEEAVDRIIDQRVEAARAQGLSWEAIAQRLGISRQAAHKRFVKGKSKKARRKQGTTFELRVERDRVKRDRVKRDNDSR